MFSLRGSKNKNRMMIPVKSNKEHLILVGEKNNKDATWFRLE